jgi:hypothetical protein
MYHETRAVLYTANVFTYGYSDEEDIQLRLVERVKAFKVKVGTPSFNLIRQLSISALKQLTHREVFVIMYAFPALRSVELLWRSRNGREGSFLPCLANEANLKLRELKLPIHLTRAEVVKEITAESGQTDVKPRDFTLDSLNSQLQKVSSSPDLFP